MNDGIEMRFLNHRSVMATKEMGGNECGSQSNWKFKR